jgi:hypothetical protein
MTPADLIGRFLTDLDADRASAARLAVQKPPEQVAEEPEEPVVLIPSIVTYRRFKTV